MATEILLPQDVLVQRFRVHATPCPRRRNSPASGASTSPAAKKEKVRRPNQRGDPRRRSEIGGAAVKITLLRRGESLNSLATKIGDPSPVEIRARSDSELVAPRKVRSPPMVDVYAGSGFESSPSPRCLPRPSFCGVKDEAFEDGATRSLRRMLRLE